MREVGLDVTTAQRRDLGAGSSPSSRASSSKGSIRPPRQLVTGRVTVVQAELVESVACARRARPRCRAPAAPRRPASVTAGIVHSDDLAVGPGRIAQRAEQVEDRAHPERSCGSAPRAGTPGDGAARTRTRSRPRRARCATPRVRGRAHTRLQRARRRCRPRMTPRGCRASRPRSPRSGDDARRCRADVEGVRRRHRPCRTCRRAGAPPSARALRVRTDRRCAAAASSSASTGRIVSAASRPPNATGSARAVHRERRRPNGEILGRDGTADPRRGRGAGAGIGACIGVHDSVQDVGIGWSLREVRVALERTASARTRAQSSPPAARVSTDSGWNCTPTHGSSRWRTAMTRSVRHRPAPRAVDRDAQPVRHGG